MKSEGHWLRPSISTVVALALGAAGLGNLAASAALLLQANDEIAITGEHFSIGGLTRGMPVEEVRATLERSGWVPSRPRSAFDFRRSDRGGRETFAFSSGPDESVYAIEWGRSDEHLIPFEEDRDRLIAALGKADECVGAEPASMPFGLGAGGVTVPTCTWRRQIGAECEVFHARWEPRPGSAEYSVRGYRSRCAELRVP